MPGAGVAGGTEENADGSRFSSFTTDDTDAEIATIIFISRPSRRRRNRAGSSLSLASVAGEVINSSYPTKKFITVPR